MTKDEFITKLAEAFGQDCDAEGQHEDADDVLIKALTDLGYDCSIFTKACKWYA